ncbi:DUF1801 domain-containing protein [Rubrivirga sp.]|uniref:DUF1801 domain-containing protein n=1 Tax=Rubrivirga sp. TaxID=1885344 RepID=UPI003C768941
MIGFGEYRYRYASGREGDWMRVGFAPAKRHIAFHMMAGTSDVHREILGRPGPHRAGAGRIRVTRLGSIDLDVLRELRGQPGAR